MTTLACFIVFSLSFFCVGHFVLSRLLKESFHDVSQGVILICSFSIGLIVFSYYWFLIAQIHFLGYPAVYLYLGISTVIIFVEYRSLQSVGIYLARGISAVGSKCITYKVLLAAIFIAITATLLRCWSSYIEGDSLVYHLYLPKQFVLQGGFWQVPYSEHLYWPLFSEIVFVPGEILKSLELSKFITFCVYVSFCLLTGLFVRRETKNDSAFLIAVSTAALCPAFFFHAPSTYNDIYFSFYLLLGLYLLTAFESKRVVFIAGLFTGTALAIKFTGLYGLIAMIPSLFFHSADKQSRACFSKKIILFAGGTAITAAPYYLRSWLHYGNPVFPFAQKIFNTPFGYGLTQTGLVGSNVSGFNDGTGRGILDFILVIWNMTFSPNLFGGDKIGYLILMLFPFVFVSLKKNIFPLIYAVIYTFIWFFLSQYNRYLLPVLALIAVMGSIGLDAFCQRLPQIKRPAVIYFTIIVAIHSAWPIYHCYKDFFIRKPESIIPVANWLNTLIKNPAEKVLTVEDERLYYYNFAAFRESTFRNFTLYPDNADPKNTVDLLDKENARYLLIARLPGESPKGFDPVSYFENLVKAGYYHQVGTQKSSMDVPYNLYVREDAKL